MEEKEIMCFCVLYLVDCLSNGSITIFLHQDFFFTFIHFSLKKMLNAVCSTKTQNIINLLKTPFELMFLQFDLQHYQQHCVSAK